MDYTNFWTRVNTLIKQSGKTQSSLSLECGFTERRINNLSAGNRSPDVNETVAIAQKLGVSVEYLVTGIQDNTINLKLIKQKLKELNDLCDI